MPHNDQNYAIRPAIDADLPSLTNLYNSNPAFLKNHLGVQRVDVDFIRKELGEMMAAGYRSCVLVDRSSGQIMALCDYKPGEETYLSLLMIDGAMKGKGLGRQIYGYLEEVFRRAGACWVRIDVVDDYKENVMGFWEKQGFLSQERISLSWDSHHMSAQMMKKELV